MDRQSGIYKTTRIAEESVKAFSPLPLPPKSPALDFAEGL